MSDILQVPGFLDPTLLEEVRQEVRRTQGSMATLQSTEPAGRVLDHVRKTTLLQVGAPLRERMVSRALESRELLQSRFGRPLGDCEEPQFLFYRPGDFFVAHQDGNSPMIYDRSRFRRVSVVMFLSAPSEYAGGDLVFHGSGDDWQVRVPVRPPAGALVAFPSEKTHEVTSVTEGERYTVVFWFHAPKDSA